MPETVLSFRENSCFCFFLDGKKEVRASLKPSPSPELGVEATVTAAELRPPAVSSPHARETHSQLVGTFLSV